MYSKFFKPIIDFVIASILLFLFLPIIFIVYFLLLINNGGDVFFVQKRPGFQTKPFNIIKFKTMLDLIDENGNLLPDELRLTRIGRFIRTTSLDEILQFINVIKGDMSIVGPRPLLMDYLSRYSTDQLRRHNVKPGITGWAQINGRNAITWEEKFKFDLEYVDKLSFLFDLKILAFTFLKVINRKGINSIGHPSGSQFKG